MLRDVSRAITRIEDKACEIIKEAESLCKQKDRAEYALEQLGVLIDRIREAGKLQKQPYKRTEERERDDEEKKRKQEEEEEEEKKREFKCQKIVGITPEGKEIKDKAEEKPEEKSEEQCSEQDVEQLEEPPKQEEEVVTFEIDQGDEELLSVSDITPTLKQDPMLWTPSGDLAELLQSEQLPQ